MPFYVVKNEIKEGTLKTIELKESFDKFRPQLVYHKNKSIYLPMGKLIEIVLKNSCNWK
ncbi:LysR family transcriptional regulator [Clostridium sp. L74]|nr:LysR family transcriptional regulator [Clostridium sp. L74]